MQPTRTGEQDTDGKALIWKNFLTALPDWPIWSSRGEPP